MLSLRTMVKKAAQINLLSLCILKPGLVQPQTHQGRWCLMPRQQTLLKMQGAVIVHPKITTEGIQYQIKTCQYQAKSGLYRSTAWKQTDLFNKDSKLSSENHSKGLLPRKNLNMRSFIRSLASNTQPSKEELPDNHLHIL